MEWSVHARDELARHGHRTGGARDAVIELLAGQSCCLSAQTIHDRLRGGGRTVGLASVYRALETLTALGLVHRLDVGGTAAYEPADPGGHHHHHVICSDCGAVDLFEDDRLERAIHDLGDRLGYRVDAHDVVLRGACPDCSTAAPR